MDTATPDLTMSQYSLQPLITMLFHLRELSDTEINTAKQATISFLCSSIINARTASITAV
jgi:hypothetical protein